MNPTLGVLVLILAILALTIGIQKLTIWKREREIESLKKSLLTSHKNHANEREVSAKLEADLKQADNEFDLLSKDSAQWKTLLNESLDDYVKLERQYTDLIAMPRRKRDKVIAELRKEMGVKVAKVVKVKEGLVRGLTVKNPTEDEAKEIFALAKELRLEVYNGKLPNKEFPYLWFATSEQISRRIDVSFEIDIYVTASEFMQRMRNHASKSH